MSVEETKIETYEYSEGRLVRKILKRDSSYGISYVPIDGQLLLNSGLFRSNQYVIKIVTAVG